MIEKNIYLEHDSLIDFYGKESENIKKIKQLFPKLKIVIRGDEIKADGEENEIENFSRFIDNIKKQIERYNKLEINDIELIFQEKIQFNKSEDVIVYGVSGKPIVPRSENQKKFVIQYQKNDMLFAVGLAGTGKTYLAIALAVRALKNNEIKRIILSRPAVEAGENLGFLPGDLKNKLDPYLQALYDALLDILPGAKLNKLMEQGVIQIAPLAFMRGRTLSDAVVILDEAQNTTVAQLKMFLTRMGENSKFIITGDITQIDLPKKSNSGLLKVSKILKGIKGIEFIFFNKDDIVRHKLVSPIIEAFEKDG
ncbi:MAG: PhoH family protein [Bacteroidales bacterium]|nr:PhoH family protein [Bacteroidales bacterium]